MCSGWHLPVNPIASRLTHRCERSEFQIVIAHRFLDGVGGGIHRDLELLIPQSRLGGFKLAVEQAGIVHQLEALLPQLQHGQRGEHADDDADQ